MILYLTKSPTKNPLATSQIFFILNFPWPRDPMDSSLYNKAHIHVEFQNRKTCVSFPIG